MATLELIVNVDCHGCEKKVRRALKNLDGVDDVEIDMELQKATVSGWAEQEEVLKVVRKTGRSAELWPLIPYNSDCFGFIQQPHAAAAAAAADLHPYNHPSTDNITCRCHVHGYINGNEHYDHQQLPAYSNINGETPFVALSDENVNACSIM